MVRWCLYLRPLSSSEYEVVRESGAIRLPSQRTLHDYTYHTKAVAGFSRGVDEQLRIATKLPQCPEREKCVIIVFDEMHLREDLSYDKHTGGFILSACIHVAYTYICTYCTTCTHTHTTHTHTQHNVKLTQHGVGGDMRKRERQGKLLSPVKSLHT